jgi:hypothetical protein
MAQVTFPIVPDGLLLRGLVNREAAALRASGQPSPPIPATGQIDTGSNISGVAGSILQLLNIPIESQGVTTGISGPVVVNLYRVALHLWDDQNPHLPWSTHPSLLVMELNPGFPVDVLVGMDIVNTFKLIVDGPAGQFTLDF